MKHSLRVDLEPLRAQADAEVRRQAEAYRMRYITPGHGKAMAYQQKATEALEFIASEDAGLPVPEEDYPHVYGEAAALGITPREMAVIIVTLRRQWQVASAAIERIEREHLVLVESAASPRELGAAVEIDWSEVVALASV